MAEATMSMNKSPTIKEYVESYRSEPLTYSSFYLAQVLNDSKTNRKLKVNFNSLVVKYMPELRKMVTKVTLNNEDYAKYKYNPKLMSYDLYGTTEFWFLLLDINELHSVTEFDLKTVYVFTPDIVDKLSRILNLEEEVVNYNEEVVSSDLRS